MTNRCMTRRYANDSHSWSADNPDRRKAVRYAIAGEVHYKLLAPSSSATEGTGTTLNISTGGILFAADQTIPAGSGIKVHANLTADAHSRLVAVGRVVRSAADATAIEFSRYELFHK